MGSVSVHSTGITAPCGAAPSLVRRPLQVLTIQPTADCTLHDTGDSDRLITASADQTMRIWELQTGKSLFEFQLGSPCRAVDLAIGDHLLAFTTDQFTQSPPSIHIVNHEADISEQTDKKLLTIVCPKGRATRVFWADQNRSLISSHDGGFLRRWDVEVCLDPAALRALWCRPRRAGASCRLLPQCRQGRC